MAGAVKFMTSNLPVFQPSNPQHKEDIVKLNGKLVSSGKLCRD